MAAPGLGFSEVPDLGGLAAAAGFATASAPNAAAGVGFGPEASLITAAEVSATAVAALGTPASRLTDPDLGGPADPEFGSAAILVLGFKMDSLVLLLVVV